MLRLIDKIVRELQGRNLLGDIKYVCLNVEAEKELLQDYQDEFAVEYEELGRSASKYDLNDYFKAFKVKLVRDNSISSKDKYKLLAEA